MPSPPLPLIQSLSPRIAVLASDDVGDSCQANGCAGLEELLRPWEGATDRVSILSSTLVPTVHPTFPLRFVAYSAVFPVPETAAPQPDVVVDLVSSLVGSRQPDDEQAYPLTRSLLLSTRPTACHETFNHPVGVLLAVSTSTPEPLQTLAKLLGRAIGPMSQAVPWLDGISLMRLFVVVHDVGKMGDNLTPANELLAAVKKAYGPHSTLLVINSKARPNVLPSPDITTHPSIPLPDPLAVADETPSALSQMYASALSSLTLSPSAATAAVTQDPTSPSKLPNRKLYGSRLTAEDTRRLVALVRELVVQSLVPWMEARVREWNEVWQSNRRGLTGRIFGAGRKFFTSRPSSPAPNAPMAGYNAAKGYYPVSSVEALTRRLGDFAFMLRDYRFASTVYDSLRRDTAQDRAWRYSAAATEMYGLSLLLSNPYFLPSTPPTQPRNPFTTLQHTDISSWLEQAVLAYQERVAAGQIQLDALRATVLYYEAWKMIGEFRGVGGALVRAAGESDEVPSAVMIEEAASADVKGGKAGKGQRRRAFHLALAARRYETAGLKTYSRRCLERALEVYREAPWTAVQDRIEYSLGRQAYTLGESDVAVEHFLRLLRKQDPSNVQESQAGVLEDLALAYEQLVAHPKLLEKTKDRLLLPTTIFDVQATRIIVPSSHASSSGAKDGWTNLEQRVLTSWDRKGKRPAALLPDLTKIVASVNEIFVVELVATNPLNAPLTLSDITLTSVPVGALTIEPVGDVILEPFESQTIPISVSGNATSTVAISAVSFSFNRFLPYTQSLERRGSRLHATKAQRLTPTYAKDSSLNVTVGPARPRLTLELEGLPEAVYVGEQVEVELRISNTGRVAVDNVQWVASEDILALKNVGKVDASRVSNSLATNPAMLLHSGVIQPSEDVAVQLVVSPTRPGLVDLRALVVYSNAEDANDVAATPFVANLDVSPLLELEGFVRSSQKGPEEYLVSLLASNVSPTTVTIKHVQTVSAYWDVGAVEPRAVLWPHQTFRSILRARASPKDANIDLDQKNVVAGLSKLVQGLQGVTAEEAPDHVGLHSTMADEVVSRHLAAKRAYRVVQLEAAFPAVPDSTLCNLFPLIDPLDLDISVSWSIQREEGARHGTSVLLGARLAPEFSLVEGIRRQVDDAIARGDKQARTMYEETGRLRQALVNSVLEGPLSREDDPIEVVVNVDQGAAGKGLSVGEAGLISVSFDVRNRSPRLAARWVLRLDSQDQSVPKFSGALYHRGQLAPLGRETVLSSVWASRPGLLSLSGWTLDVETGEDVQGVWQPRHVWHRRGQGWGGGRVAVPAEVSTA